MYDLILKNGMVCDGTGAEPYAADVAVEAGRIAAVGQNLSGAKQVLNVGGLMVTPGFIDCHSHGDYNFLLGADGWNQLEQGITTEVCGNCGGSPAPSSPGDGDFFSGTFPKERIEEAMRISETPEGLMEHTAQMKLGTNMAFLEGHGTLRQRVMGYCPDTPTEKQLAEMKRWLRRAMECGHLGLSTGLIYPPSVYAKTPELVELAKVVAEYGGIYASHIRGEGDFCIPAVKEAIEIGEQSGCRVEISHHKVEGVRNEGNSRVTLRLMEEAVARGVHLRCDQYPFVACSTSLSSALPPEYMTDGMEAFLQKLHDPAVRAEITRRLLADDGSFDNVLPIAGFERWMVADSLHGTALPGETIADLAEKRGCSPFEVVFDLLTENEGDVKMIYFTINESDLMNIIAHPLTSCGTDGSHVPGRPGPDAPPTVHPRYLCTFPRHLRLVREQGKMTAGQAIYRLTGAAAEQLLLPEVGYIKPGYAADLCVIDWENIGETADFLHPFRPNKGIEYVFVSGKAAVENGRATGVRAGRLLRRRME
ncbi:MAG: D-aminoacylase [Clostridiaceae bacterium]|nr:D-aminoacylase [Clostridiaceae bacterium]